jgi:hypothetical protein
MPSQLSILISNRPALAACIVTGLLSGVSISARADVPYAPPTNGLVGWWSGNGNATDSSGNGHDGTVQGEGFTTGLYGLAFASDSNERVFIPDSPAFQLTNSLTIAAWVKMTSPSYAILFRGDSRAGNDPWVLGGNGAGKIGIQIEDTTDTAAYAAADVPLNEWIHVAGTFDGDTGDLRFYINGVLATELFTSIKPFGPLDPNLAPGVAIGNTETSINFPFVGSIDEVLLYDRALSPNEIAGLVPEPGTASIAFGAGLFLIGRRLKRGMRSAECGTAVLKG